MASRDGAAKCETISALMRSAEAASRQVPQKKSTSGQPISGAPGFQWLQRLGWFALPPSFYRPVFLLWMRLNFILAELSPWGWHLLSIAKHLLVGIVLGLLVYRLLRDRLAALGAAALFMLHPSHTESVSWVTVPDPLLTLGLLLSLLFYLRYLCSFTTAPEPPIRKSRKAAEKPRPSPGR